LRTARAREVARSWPSYEMARELYAALRDGARHFIRKSAACVQRASTRIKTSGVSERAQKRPTTASKRTKHQARGACAWCARCIFFLFTKSIYKNLVGPPATRACSLCFIFKFLILLQNLPGAGHQGYCCRRYNYLINIISNFIDIIRYNTNFIVAIVLISRGDIIR